MPIAMSDQQLGFVSLIFIKLIEVLDFWNEQNEQNELFYYNSSLNIVPSEHRKWKWLIQNVKGQWDNHVTSKNYTPLSHSGTLKNFSHS